MEEATGIADAVRADLVTLKGRVAAIQAEQGCVAAIQAEQVGGVVFQESPSCALHLDVMLCMLTWSRSRAAWQPFRQSR
eukprot:1156350-Pelagomonas_calceolata.AAC.11